MTTTLAAAASNVLVLSADEAAFIIAQRQSGFTPEAALPVAEKPLSKAAVFLDKIEELKDRKINRYAGVYPLMKVNTIKGQRGVFWVGLHKGEMSVGVCKITDGGRLYKPNKYDGSGFILATELAKYNS